MHSLCGGTGRNISRQEGPPSSLCIQQILVYLHGAGAVWRSLEISEAMCIAWELTGVPYLWDRWKNFSKCTAQIHNHSENQSCAPVKWKFWRAEHYRWKMCIACTNLQWSYLVCVRSCISLLLVCVSLVLVCVRSCFFTLPVLGFGLICTSRQQLWLYAVEK